MKLTVLIDNNTLIDRYFLGEPGVSYFIESEGKKILFDLGYSDAFIYNGEKMKIDLFNIDFLAISHSHLDHTWGLEPYIKRLSEELFEGRNFNKSTFIAHPRVFDSKTFYGKDEFGITLDKEKVLKYFKNAISKEPIWLTNKLVFLGEIPRENDFESIESIGKVLIDDKYEEDYNIDDSALCYKSENGLVIITGCSHSGICNIIDYAKEVCNENKVFDVIGGFHLQNPSKIQLDKTVDYFSKLGVKKIHACHCTDLKSKIELSKVVDIDEVGVGLVIKY
ncbi:MBL fold metallo-hydrolase [Helicovermis profundi]|uniref:MBL fold metallo-hydrolase n=1 Tax=Helicovermis profundi TaxID=3065157 RepID=A0AAU9E999_9FIRM|nr:MBL fold metallo-hydrolase [Clostridia bacterium S502]